tara:strand:- start:24568 stop:26034 length:1467 start_codon:yes stop_codon:yes gene_type:complete
MKYIFAILLTIFILYYLTSKYLIIKEHYCKVPPTNRQGEPNFFNTDLEFKPQSNIRNSNCDKYWKKFATDSNSTMILNEPVPVPSDQLRLPETATGGNSIYKFGLIDFKKLCTFLNNKNIDKNLYKKSIKLIINPVTKEKLSYEYQVDFSITELNKNTDIKRFNEYNPVKTNTFKYIKSPINEVNILNKEFLKRINKEQIKIMSQKELILNGKINYQIYNYRIIDIKYINSNKNKPIFVIQVNLFQEYNYYINSFTYIGFINNKNPNLYNVEFTGIEANSNFLNTPGNDENLPTNYFILNKNFNDFQPRIKDVNEVINIVDNKKKLNDLSSNYACFNTDVDSKQTILNYDTKTLCESAIDHYGRPKSVGIYDKPCEEDIECPFYKGNQNYKNNYGGCINGKCQLPTNMKNIGYHYYSYNPNYNPLCYNCKEKNKKYNILSTTVDECCNKQFDKKKYPNLKTPDYSFSDDTIKRINDYNQKNYKTNILI